MCSREWYHFALGHLIAQSWAWASAGSILTLPHSCITQKCDVFQSRWEVLSSSSRWFLEVVQLFQRPPRSWPQSLLPFLHYDYGLERSRKYSRGQWWNRITNQAAVNLRSPQVLREVRGERNACPDRGRWLKLTDQSEARLTETVIRHKWYDYDLDIKCPLYTQAFNVVDLAVGIV